MNHLKIVAVGPTACGKTYVCNFLSEAIEQTANDYRPTVGVRILEYEINMPVREKPCKLDIELWDLSGDKKYESCWPAIFKSANGVLLVYNPNVAEHSGDIQDWYTITTKNTDLKEVYFCVICNDKSSGKDRDVVRLPANLERLTRVTCCLADQGEKFRDEFGKFLTKIITSHMEANEQEELKILNA
ncbi:unnamed protein product [Dicrocoelium dendriticum]|nr:unnamed protein product [Dicrocoelium dendriticum]